MARTRSAAPSAPPFAPGPLAPLKPNKVRVRAEFFPDGDDPDAYALVLAGNCLEPEFFNGDMAICSPAAEIRPGDFVALWPVAEGTAPILKRVVNLPLLPVGTPRHPDDEVEGCVIVEMLNPPKQLAIRVSRLRAMHRVVGRYQEEEVPAMREAVKGRKRNRRGGRA